MAEQKKSLTATGQISNQPGYYWGYVVTTTLSAAAVTLQDGLTATGVIIEIIPASTAAGVTKTLASPIKCNAGIFATVAGTGTVTFLYD